MSEGLRRLLMSLAAAVAVAALTALCMLWFGRPLYYSDGQVATFGAAAELREAPMLRFARPGPIAELGGSVRGRVATLPDGSLLYGLARGEARTELVRFDPRRGGAPEPVLALRSEGHDLSPAVAPDGSGVYFTSDRPHRDGGGYDLWWARYREGEIYAPQPLPASVNTVKDEADPEVDAQSEQLLFARRDASSDARGVFTLLQVPLAADPDAVATPLWPRRADDFAWQREVAVARDGKCLWFVQQDGLAPPLLMRSWRHAGQWLAPTVVAGLGDGAWRAPRLRDDGRALELLDAQRGLLYAAPAIEVFPWWEGQAWLERLLLTILAVAISVWSLLALGRRWRALDTVTWCILLSLLLHLAILAWLRSVEIVRRFELPPPRLGELEVSLVAGGAAASSVADDNANALARELRFAGHAQAIAAQTPNAAVAEPTSTQAPVDGARDTAAPAPSDAPSPEAALRDAAAELAQRQARAAQAQLAAERGEAVTADEQARAEAARRALAASQEGLAASVPAAQAAQADASERAAAAASREVTLPPAQTSEVSEPTLADAAAELARRAAAAPAPDAPPAAPLPTLTAQAAAAAVARSEAAPAPLPTLAGPQTRLPGNAAQPAPSAAPQLVQVTPQADQQLAPALRDQGEQPAARAARAEAARDLTAVPSGALAAGAAAPLAPERAAGAAAQTPATVTAPQSAVAATGPMLAADAAPRAASAPPTRTLPAPSPALRDVAAAAPAPRAAGPLAAAPAPPAPLTASLGALPAARALPTPRLGAASTPAAVRAPVDLLASAAPLRASATPVAPSAPQARAVDAPRPELRDGDATPRHAAAAAPAVAAASGLAPLADALTPGPAPAPTSVASPARSQPQSTAQPTPVVTGPAGLLAAAPDVRTDVTTSRALAAPQARSLTAQGPRLRDLDRASAGDAAATSTRVAASAAPGQALSGDALAPQPVAAVALLRREAGFAALSRGIRPPDSLLPLADAPLAARDASPQVAALPDLYRSRFGPQKLAALEAFGGSEQTEAAVRKGLDYLASIQRTDGAWGRRRNPHEKYGEVWVGKSALCVLAFLGAGHTHQGGTEHQRAVASALDWLIAQQDPETGHFGETSAYSHGITTYALAECYALTKDQKLRPSIDKAVAWILRNQNRTRDRRNSGGWGYFSPTLRPEDRFARSSITAWMIMALKSAQLSGLDVPDVALADAQSFLWRMFDEEAGNFLYSKDPSRLESSWRTLPGSTPASAFCLSLLGADPADRRMRAAWAWTLERAPRDYRRYDTDAFVLQGAGNVYFWYYGSLSCFLAGGEVWAAWNEALKRVLLDGQSDDGSFAPIDEYASYAGDTDRDRAYTTAMCVLSLEVYYRYFTPLVKPR